MTPIPLPLRRARGSYPHAELLYEQGEKITGARLAILAALSSFNRPISIKELGKAVKDCDKTTIYRTLKRLVDKDIVRKVTVHSSESLYETNLGRTHHHHITCTSCGKIEDIDICSNMPSEKKLRSKGFVSLTNHSLEFFGLCKECFKP